MCANDPTLHSILTHHLLGLHTDWRDVSVTLLHPVKREAMSVFGLTMKDTMVRMLAQEDVSVLLWINFTGQNTIYN